MKTKFIFLLLVFFFIAEAASYSPPYFDDINIEVNSQECYTIYNDPGKNYQLFDAWAEDYSENWNINKYTFTAESKEITITYPETISAEENEIEFCLTGSNTGKYKGALVLREGQEGNVVVQHPVWLLVTITEPQTQETQEETNTPDNTDDSSNNNGGGGSSSSSSTTTTQTSLTLEEAQTLPPQNPDNPQTNSENQLETNNAPITGNVINEEGDKNNHSITIIILIFIALAGVLVYKKRKQ